MRNVFFYVMINFENPHNLNILSYNILNVKSMFKCCPFLMNDLFMKDSMKDERGSF